MVSDLTVERAPRGRYPRVHANLARGLDAGVCHEGFRHGLGSDETFCGLHMGVGHGAGVIFSNESRKRFVWPTRRKLAALLGMGILTAPRCRWSMNLRNVVMRMMPSIGMSLLAGHL